MVHQNGGLTISGGATTTGNAYFAGKVGVQATGAQMVIGANNIFQVGPLTNSTTHYSQFFGAYDSNTGYPQLLFNNPNNFMAIGVSTVGDLVFGTSAAGTAWTSQQLVLQQTTGNLGLGTSSPYQKLSVAGNVVAGFVYSHINDTCITLPGWPHCVRFINNRQRYSKRRPHY
jgi:hypothetical protein